MQKVNELDVSKKTNDEKLEEYSKIFADHSAKMKSFILILQKDLDNKAKNEIR